MRLLLLLPQQLTESCKCLQRCREYGHEEEEESHTAEDDGGDEPCLVRPRKIRLAISKDEQAQNGQEIEEPASDAKEGDQGGEIANGDHADVDNQDRFSDQPETRREVTVDRLDSPKSHYGLQYLSGAVHAKNRLSKTLSRIVDSAYSAYDRVDGRLASRMQSREPFRKVSLPSCHEDQASTREEGAMMD